MIRSGNVIKEKIIEQDCSLRCDWFRLCWITISGRKSKSWDTRQSGFDIQKRKKLTKVNKGINYIGDVSK